MPSGVRLAVILLWAAWSISACAWLVHLYEVRGLGADRYAVLGFPAALLQALLIYLIGKGNNVARLLVLWVAIPAFVVVQIFFSAAFDFSALRLGVETALRGTALILLIAPESARWFHGGAPR